MVYAVVESDDMFGSAEDAGLLFRVFPRGPMILASNLCPKVPTEYRFRADPDGIHISAQYFLSGEASILMGDGSAAFWSANGMSIIRSDTPGFRLRVEPGQILRHVCVAMYLHDLSALENAANAPHMQRLLAKDGPVDMAIPIPANTRMRSKAMRVLELSRDNGIHALQAEAEAMSFLADALHMFSTLANEDEKPGRPAPWQRIAAQQIQQLIDAAPLQPIGKDALFARFGMGEAMANRIFRAEIGMTLTGYVRRARLVWARQALGRNERVKSIALACGYTHVGNFSRAYRQEFGESPSETRARTRAG